MEPLEIQIPPPTADQEQHLKQQQEGPGGAAGEEQQAPQSHGGADDAFSLGSFDDDMLEVSVSQPWHSSCLDYPHGQILPVFAAAAAAAACTFIHSLCDTPQCLCKHPCGLHILLLQVFNSLLEAPSPSHASTAMGQPPPSSSSCCATTLPGFPPPAADHHAYADTAQQAQVSRSSSASPDHDSHGEQNPHHHHPSYVHLQLLHALTQARPTPHSRALLLRHGVLDSLSATPCT